MGSKQPTILTNLQRGNVKQESPIIFHQRTIHELAAQGEIHHIDPQMIDLLDSNNMTPLQWAAGYGQNSTVEFLLKLNANPNHHANCGITALMLAASKGFLHVTRTLLTSGARVNDVDQSGNSALMYAASQEHPQVVQELIKNGADLGIVNHQRQSAYTLALLNKSKLSQAVIEAQLVALINGTS